MNKDELPSIVADVWNRLTLGAKDRRSALHTPVVASVDADGRPQQRVMVLRAADKDCRQLRFHTDARTSKVREISDSGRVSILGYDPGAKIQIRASGVGKVETNSEAAETAWQSASLSSRRCYLAPIGPGSQSPEPTSGLPPSLENRVPDLSETLPAREHFAILLVTLDRLEWLYLASDGHRRAAFSWDRHGWTGQWLVP